LCNANEISIIVTSIMPFLGPDAAGEPPGRPRVRLSLPVDARERDEVQGAHHYRYLDDHSAGVMNDSDIATERASLGFAATLLITISTIQMETKTKVILALKAIRIVAIIGCYLVYSEH
jgi:hypothetical protein